MQDQDKNRSRSLIVRLTRRQVLRAGAGLAALSWGGAIFTSRRAVAADAPPDMAAAKKEGPLILVHGTQQGDIVKLLNAFQQKTGLEAKELRLLPGAALPKFEGEFRTGRFETDVYMGADAGLFAQMDKKNQILRYVSPEAAILDAKYKSRNPGVWTAYHYNIGPIMWDPRFVKPEEAPKTWADLLHPRWKGQIGFQNSAAGSQYAWWYVLKDVLPADYWDKLALNKPRAYASSTQQVTDMQNGNLLIGRKVSIFQYAQSKQAGQPLEVAFPPEGVPGSYEVVGILSSTKRPNASKIFVDYLLSKEGQEKWAEYHGQPSGRPDVQAPDLPDLTKVNALYPTNLDDFESEENHKKFVALWNKVTGF